MKWPDFHRNGWQIELHGAPHGARIGTPCPCDGISHDPNRKVDRGMKSTSVGQFWCIQYYYALVEGEKWYRLPERAVSRGTPDQRPPLPCIKLVQTFTNITAPARGTLGEKYRPGLALLSRI